jgi:YfiR/HmsC-like
MMNLRSAWAQLVSCRALVRAGAVIVILALASSGLGGAQQDERAVRAAFVFNLTKYVSWPGARDHLVIGVVGNGNFGTVLKQILDTKLSDGRPITVVIHTPDSDLGECDVLYVADQPPAAMKSILNRAAERAVLTVGDNDQFVRAGGMVALVRSGDQIEIEVNLPALRNRKLDMSSRLLKLAVLTPAGGGLR